jgi:hypothetical protein
VRVDITPEICQFCLTWPLVNAYEDYFLPQEILGELQGSLGGPHASGEIDRANLAGSREPSPHGSYRKRLISSKTFTLTSQFLHNCSISSGYNEIIKVKTTPNDNQSGDNNR